MKIISKALMLSCGLLAVSFSAGARSPAAAGSQARLDARVAPCNAAWISGAVYTAGDKVSYGGVNYNAAYWTQGNNPTVSSGAGTTAQPWITGASCQQAKAGANDHDANFSPATLQFLKTNTGLDGEQWDNIMKLINKPEQDSLDWTKYYGYCENINDDRGYTIGIFGATTGGSNDEGPDGPALFKEFDAASGAANPSIAGGLARAGAHGNMQGAILKITDSKADFYKRIEALQNNPAWREAMWHTFYNVYIKYSLQQARQRGFTTALTIGSFVDTALNQGASGDSDTLEGVLSRSGSSADEKTFMTSFYAQRSKIVDTNQYNQPPNGKNRVKEWSTLLNQGETDLKNADAAVVKVTRWTMH